MLRSLFVNGGRHTMVIRATVSPVSPSSPQERRVQSRWSSSSASVRMTNSEAFVETLRVQNTQDVFGIVGSAFMDPLDLFPNAGIRFISVQHEQNAAHMADGYSRVTDRAGVCIAQNGPGITNFVTGIAAAYWAHSPVVAITPEAGSMGVGHGGFQETNQLPIFQPITKYQAHVNNGARMAELTARAFDYALRERGPAQVNIPRDFFYGENDFSIPSPLPITRVKGANSVMNESMKLLKKSKRPVLLVGGGVVMGNASQQAISLAEALQLPVCTTYLHNDAFPASHPLYCGPLGALFLTIHVQSYNGSMAAMKCIHEADLVIALGTRISPFGANPQYGFDYWPKKAKLIQVDQNPRALSLVKRADVNVCADAAEFCSDMLARIKVTSFQWTQQEVDARLQEMKKHQQQWAEELSQMSVQTPSAGGDSALMKPRAVLNELQKALQSHNDPVVSTDIGNVCAVANSYLNFNRPKSFLGAMTFGNCGYATPAAMGARVGLDRQGQGDRACVAYVGDGAFGMSINEILTCEREDIPVTVVVFNNQQWGAEKKNQVLWFGDRYVGSNLKNPSFAAIGKAMGIEGVRVTSLDQVSTALTEAMNRQTKDRKATIVENDTYNLSHFEVMLTRELGDPFRRDAMRLPHRLLAKYANTNERAESATGQPIDWATTCVSLSRRD